MMTATSPQGEGSLVPRPWYRRASTLVAAAVVMMVIGWASGLFSRTFMDSLRSKAKPTLAAKSTPAVTVPSYVTPPPPVGNDSSISPVPLPLILTGTMPGRNAHEGTAFIGVNKDSPQTYSAGAILANNARIAEIYTDHVVLEKEGKRVNLYLLGSGKRTNPTTLASLLTVGGTPPPPPAKITSHEVITDYLRPSPVYDGQQLKGYQVYPGQQAGIFAQLGMQPGDILLAINGVPLNEPHTAVSLLQQLTQGYAMTASIERQGKTESLSLDGALITKNQLQQQSPPSVSTMP